MKLHLGCGKRILPGWTNVDAERWVPEVERADLSKPFPWKDQSVDLIYAEHFLEHLDENQGLQFLMECKRVLKRTGTLRISTPNLKALARAYMNGEINFFAGNGGEWYPRTPAQMLNQGMRHWGHQYLFDREELELYLRAAGFEHIQKKNWGRSIFVEFRNLESRPDFSDLIFEASP